MWTERGFVVDAIRNLPLTAPHGLAWMVCENHHDVLIAAGEPVATRLAAM